MLSCLILFLEENHCFGGGGEEGTCNILEDLDLFGYDMVKCKQFLHGANG